MKKFKNSRLSTDSRKLQTLALKGASDAMSELTSQMTPEFNENPNIHSKKER